jgi:hypothetical protein
MPGVLEVQTYGAMLHVFVDSLAVRKAEIEVALSAGGIGWTGMRPIAVRMEEAFISLIQRQEGRRMKDEGRRKKEE